MKKIRSREATPECQFTYYIRFFHVLGNVKPSGRLGPLHEFDYVFLIPLRYVNNDSPLPELVRTQLGLDTEVPLQAILQGKISRKVLIILDGYDEYTRGTNKDIDKLIKSPSRNFFIILTSRFGEYLKKSTRSQMDGEIVIKGFSPENIVKCSSLYLGSEETSHEFLKQAKQSQIKNLLHVPIVLLMSCMVFTEKGSLPKTQTELFNTAQEVIISRTTLKTFGKKSTELEELESWLDILGEMSWKALQGDEKQLLLDKVSKIFTLDHELMNFDQP